MDTALRGQRLLTLFRHKNPIESVSSFILSPKESQDLRGSMLGIKFLDTKKQFHILSATYSVHIEYSKLPNQEQIIHLFYQK